MRPRATAAAWLAWAAVVLGLANGVATDVLCSAGAPPTSSLDELAAWVRTCARPEHGDTARYQAYADATLGRAHNTHYVRTADAWRMAAHANDDGDPARAPWATPAGALAPYRDFLVEYPPGFFLVALPPALLARSVVGYRLLFSVEMALLLTAALGLSLRLLRALPGAAPSTARAVAWSAASVAALGTLPTHRIDAALALLVVTMVLAAARGRPALAGAAAGLAFATKLVPAIAVLPCAAWWLAERRGRDLARATVAGAAVAAALVVPAMLVGGDGLFDLVRYHHDRPFQVETTGGALLGLWRLVDADAVTGNFGYGSFNATAPGLAWLSTLFGVVLVGGLLAVLLVTRRRLAADLSPGEAAAAVAEAVMATLVVPMVAGKVFSPQYLVWLLPLGMVLSLRRRGRLHHLLLAVLVLSLLVYPVLYPSVTRLAPWASGIVLARNALLAIWAWRLVRPGSGVLPDDARLAPARA